MGGATVRIVTLISTPIPSLHLQNHRSSSCLHLLRRLSSLSSPLFLSPPPAKLSSHSPSHKPNVIHSYSPHSRPEWSHFVHRVSIPGHRTASVIDEFVEPSALSDGFLDDATGFLAFGRQNPSLLWSLPKEDIEVVVESVSPSLFKDSAAVMAKMRSFLSGEFNHVLESDKPSTVDLMKFLLSYVHMAISSSEEGYIFSRAESSVRKLFSELVKSNGTYLESSASVQKQFPEIYEKGSTSFGKSIEMKRGDYICSRCSFMNFAKNQKCLQCEEPRPKRYLTGGEWECPQCDFFNFSRNVVCLRCDCKKPELKFQSTTNVSGFGAYIPPFKNDSDKSLAGSDNQEQQWFTKLAQLEKSSDLSKSIADDDFLESMKAVDDRFGEQTRNLGVGENSSGGNRGESNVTVDISRSLGELLGGESIRDDSPLPTCASASPLSGHIDARSSRHSFRTANEQSCQEKPAIQKGEEVRKQAGKSEKWCKEVTELEDVKDVRTAISDQDFPDIIPMRHVENRFVVSKKKDRSLASPMYKRRVAMEQASNSNFVPFVPFPPGYFAQGKTQKGPDSMITSSRTEEPSDARSSDPAPITDQVASVINSDAGSTVRRNEDNGTNFYEASNKLHQSQEALDSQLGSTDMYSKNERSIARDFNGASSQSLESPKVADSWSGKSLEGSAVKEPDPLDMSEEAKAERWFRRVAQIKDISELSQIPDEDFPSIMPMRKGVNRFVVSKRKTPLERRLASSQYRKNPPVVDVEPYAGRKQDESN